MKNSLLNDSLRGLSKSGRKAIAIVLTAVIFTASAGFVISDDENPETIECLEIIGIALNEKNEAIEGVEVKLFKKNEEMEWMQITAVPHHDHNFKFVLCENEYYTIEVTKPGYVKRAVVVSTFLPKNVSPKPMFSFGFEVTMFKEKVGMDEYYLDFPIALIGYNKSTGVFENSYTYTRHIKSKIKDIQSKVLVEDMINGKY